MENDLHVKYFSMFAVKYFTCKIFFNGRVVEIVG
jgi:hypothetical protein